MAQVEKLLVFLASPGDVKTERRHVHEVIDELNRTTAGQLDLVLQVVSWERDAFPGFGHDAQAIINSQIAEMSKYDLFIGIIWNRLGTPTPRALSGTVEEFERAVEARQQSGKPEIWFYFRESPARLDTPEELDQRRRVLEFRDRVRNGGMPWSYGKPLELRDLLRTHLTYWLSKRRDAELTAPAGRPENEREGMNGDAVEHPKYEAAALESDDREAAHWTGATEAKSRRLTAVIRRVSHVWFHVRLEITSTDPLNPLVEPVLVHLHPTFPDPDRWIRPSGGLAVWQDFAYGAFPVFVETDRGQVGLKLDLAAIRGVPEEFRHG